MADRVTDKDMGYNRLMELLEETGEAFTLVGFRDTGNVDGGSETVASIAASNEFGVPERNVPERSFMRSTMDENEKKYARHMRRGLGRVIDGKSELPQELGLLGLRGVADVQAKIVDLKEPPNAPSTIRRKKSANPLVDTGRMRQSVDQVVVIDGVRQAGA